jgi:hypothetical protein
MLEEIVASDQVGQKFSTVVFTIFGRIAPCLQGTTGFAVLIQAKAKSRLSGWEYSSAEYHLHV